MKTEEYTRDMIDIEFKRSSTGSYSPWHLDIANSLGVNLWCTSDIGYFVKVGDDIYNIFYSNDYYDLYKYVCDLEKKNDNGELSDEEALSLLAIALNNPTKIKKCMPLDEFRNKMLNNKTKV